MPLSMEGGARSPSNIMSPGPRPTFVPTGVLIHPAVWPQQTCTEKWGFCGTFREGGAGSPSNTMSPGPRPTSVRSSVLIHPAVWPQYVNVTDRQTGQKAVLYGRPKISLRLVVSVLVLDVYWHFFFGKSTGYVSTN